MNFAQAKALQTGPVTQATWCIPLRGDDEILLAMKKRGFGVGLWNASGGKVQAGETPVACAAREIREEFTLEVTNLQPVAAINFYFAVTPKWNQQVFGFTTRDWTGTPSETEEMSPRWFKYSQIPYDQMWPDDPLWLPKVLAGEKVGGEFLFDDHNRITEYHLWPLQS